MKSFFNKATQRIYEAFNGPKVKDTEFDDKIKEMQESEKGLMILRELFINCEKNFTGLRLHCVHTYSSIKSLYDGSKEYETISKDIIDIHKEMENALQSFFKQLNDVKNMTDEWVGMFRDARISIERREELRREYEHYDSKMEDIMKERAQNSSETPKDIEKYNRVIFLNRMN